MTNASVPPELSIRPLAESGVLVEVGATIESRLVARVMALTSSIDAAALPGVVDVVPSYTTIMVVFDPSTTDTDHVISSIRHLAVEPTTAAPPSAREVTIPVAYGGAHGPDLAAVADYTGLAPDEVVARHANGDYLVACMGFAPGFGFLVGLPSALETPRRPSPRTRVPRGSVGIGGAQTGVYSLDTPGGWNLIGRTPVPLVDLGGPAPFLLQPGDRVTFEPISAARYEEIASQGAVTTNGPNPELPSPPPPLSADA